MEWSDQGIVLSARPHGEGGMVVALLTHDHGRHAGFVPGGGSRRARPAWQLGNLVDVRRRGAPARPAGEPHPAMFDGFSALLGALDHPGWPGIYVRLELGLLQELGFGLDLTKCAGTGCTEALG